MTNLALVVFGAWLKPERLVRFVHGHGLRLLLALELPRLKNLFQQLQHQQCQAQTGEWRGVE